MPCTYLTQLLMDLLCGTKLTVTWHPMSSVVNFNNFTLFSATPVLLNQWLWLRRQRLFGITPLRLCHHSALVSSLSRRLFLPSVSGIWDALTGGNSASIAVRRGMQLFRQV
ncbi:hypothetical protein AAC387_Pa02g2274 [Persea americana]